MSFFVLVSLLLFTIFSHLYFKSYNVRLSLIRQRKVTKTVIFITLTFIVLWFPVHFLATWYRLDANFPEDSHFYLFKQIAHTMSYANSSVNPLIYGFSNESFRLSIANLWRNFFSTRNKNTNKNNTRKQFLKEDSAFL